MFPIPRIQIDYIDNAVDYSGIRMIHTTDVTLSCVFYRFPLCSAKVDLDVETFDHTGFRMIQFWIK